MAKKGQIQKRYSTEFKTGVIMDMREHRLGYRETARKYGLSGSGSTVDLLKRWERIFLEEESEGLMKERRGRACKASGSNKRRPPKLDRNIEKLKEYIHYYNNKRISLKLKGMSPVQYRAHSLTI